MGVPGCRNRLQGGQSIASGICVQITDETKQEALSVSRLLVRNTTPLLAMVRAGVGITVSPRLGVENSPSEIKFMTVDDLLAMRRIVILRRTQTRLSAMTQKFELAINKVHLI